MAYTRRYTPRSLAPDRPLEHDPALETEDYDLDAQLHSLAKKVVRRLHQEIQNYSVPQLLQGLHKCLQVRVLMVTLTQKGGGSDVGSAVRKYTGAFTQEANDRSRKPAAGGRGKRAARAYDDDTIVQLVTDD